MESEIITLWMWQRGSTQKKYISNLWYWSGSNLLVPYMMYFLVAWFLVKGHGINCETWRHRVTSYWVAFLPIPEVVINSELVSITLSKGSFGILPHPLQWNMVWTGLTTLSSLENFSLLLAFFIIIFIES